MFGVIQMVYSYRLWCQRVSTEGAKKLKRGRWIFHLKDGTFLSAGWKNKILMLCVCERRPDYK